MVLQILNLNSIIHILLIFSISNVPHASAQVDIYIDTFDNLISARWRALTSDTWQIINGIVYSRSSRTGLIFEKWEVTHYIENIDFTANMTLYNFYLRPIEMKNVWLHQRTQSHLRLPFNAFGRIRLRLVEGIDSEGTMFSLSKFGKKVDSTIALYCDQSSWSAHA